MSELEETRPMFFAVSRALATKLQQWRFECDE